MLGWHPEFCQQLASAGFFVIRHDNRDIGLSQKFPDGGSTLTDMAADTAELLDALYLRSAHVVGQSMGGMIAQELAIDFPQTVRSLTLIYSAAGPDHMLSIVNDRTAPQTDHDRTEAIENFVKNEAPAASPAYPHDDAWIRQLGGLMYDRDHEPAATDRQLAAIYASRERRPALRTLTMPTAILHGDSDNLVDPAAAEELHELIPHSTPTVYAGPASSARSTRTPPGTAIPTIRGRRPVTETNCRDRRDHHT